MSDMDFVRQYEPEAQPLYPPSGVCIGVRTFFRNSESVLVRGTKRKGRRLFTDARSRVLSDKFWREGEGYSWEQAHNLAWADAARRLRSSGKCGAWEVVG